MIRKFVLFSVLLLLLVTQVSGDPNDHDDNQDIVDTGINNLTLNQLTTNQLIDVSFGLVKVTNESDAVLGVYRNRDSEKVFLDRDTVLKYEVIQFQVRKFDEKNNRTYGVFYIKDYQDYDVENDSYVDLIETEYRFEFDQGDNKDVGYKNIELQPTERERFIVVQYLDVKYYFTHITVESNLPFDEDLTKGEYFTNLRNYGAISSIVSGGFILSGIFFDRRAKNVAIPSKAIWILLPIFGFLVASYSTLSRTFEDLYFSEKMYFVLIAIIGFIIGLATNTVGFVEYIGYKSTIKDGKEHRELFEVRLYRLSETDKRFAIALDGFWEAMRRLGGQHTIFRMHANNSISTDGYVDGYDIETEGFVNKKNGGVDGKQVYEWNTVPYHKLPLKKVSDVNERLEIAISIINESEKQKNDMRSNQEPEVNRRVNIQLEAHYSKLGVNQIRTNAISDEDIKFASLLKGIEEPEFRASLTEAMENYDEDGKIEQGAIKRLVRRVFG